jgi:hypothetical protein
MRLGSCDETLLLGLVEYNPKMYLRYIFSADLGPNCHPAIAAALPLDDIAA